MSRSALPPVIRALLHPSAYPHPTGRIKLIQTHVSYVLLAGDYVYKVKKPVNFGFLDFSTLSKRRYYCHQEVILNSRLCADTYLGVVAIRDNHGRISIGGARGRIMEYAVQMRRLPAERMMDRLLREGRLTVGMVERVAGRLARFHAAAETSPRIAAYGDWAIRYAWRENFRQWKPYVGQTLTTEQERVLQAYGEAFFARKRDILRRRVEMLRIRDCHSDLRSDAVCFVDGICIFDCVEFNRRLRYVDIARDVGFLAMDLDYREAPALADGFLRRYLEVSADEDVREIIDFYRCYNACVRAKVDGFRLGQPEVPAAERRAALEAARRYFHLACRYAASLPPALLVITCGLPATGKSTLARTLAGAAGLEVVSSDVVRKRLAGLAPSERRFEEFGKGIYAAEYTDRTYQALLEHARQRLQTGQSVIIDASFLRRAYRREARCLAEETGAQFACLYLEADEKTIRRRLARRLREGADPSDARWEVYTRQKRRLQKPSELPQKRVVAVDAGRPLRAQLRSVVAALRRVSPLSLPNPLQP